MSNDKPKVFDDFYTVNCNECERYWDSSCDGVQKGKEKPCSSYKATRNVVIPAQIEALKQEVTRLRWGSVLTDLTLILMYLWVMLNG